MSKIDFSAEEMKFSDAVDILESIYITKDNDKYVHLLINDTPNCDGFITHCNKIVPYSNKWIRHGTWEKSKYVTCPICREAIK